MTSYRQPQTQASAPQLVRATPSTQPHVRLLVTGTGDGASRRRARSR
jgi:hypothetical protein